MLSLKKLVKYGFIAIFLLGNANATLDNGDNNDVLVIGARPWDKNVEGFSGLDTAHFVDFITDKGPSPLPNKFHHLDLNDTGLNKSGNFSEFAKANPEKFGTLIVDWATYKSIQRNAVGEDFATLLISGGKLIIPVTHYNLLTGASLSNEKAEEFKTNKKLTDFFDQVDVVDYKTIRSDNRFDFLFRPNLEPGRLEDLDSMKAKIIIATKQGAVELDTLNTKSNISNVSKEESIETIMPQGTLLEKKVEDITVKKGNKEIKLPNVKEILPPLEEIKQRLAEGYGSIVNKNGVLFNVQLPLGGIFWGLYKTFEKPTGEDFELTLVGSNDQTAVFKVKFAGENPRLLGLKRWS